MTPPAPHMQQPPFNARLVRSIAALLAPNAEVSDAPLDDFAPDEWSYVCRYWHVAPRLWRTLRHCSGIPRTVAEQLRAEYWSTVGVSGSLRTAAHELIATLNSRGVVPLFLKGACQLFDPPSGHAGTRVMVDLDVLVPTGQDRLCFETLCDQGFVPATGWDTDRFHHWPKLARPAVGAESPLVIEIHKTPWLGGGAAEAEAFYAASVPAITVAGDARLPCTAHRLLHNAVHALEGQFRYYAVWEPHELDDAIGCTNLRQLLDFVDLCHYRGDASTWDAVVSEADRHGCRSDLEQWSFLARELCSAPVPDDLARWNVGRSEPRTAWARCHRVAKGFLRSTGMLGSVRRMRDAWMTRG